MSLSNYFLLFGEFLWNLACTYQDNSETSVLCECSFMDFAVNLIDCHYEVEVVLCVLISVKLDWTLKLRFVCSTSEEKICFNPLLHLLWHHIVRVNILFLILCAKYNGNYLFCSHCLSARSEQSSYNLTDCERSVI